MAKQAQRFDAKVYVADASKKSGRSKLGKTAVVSGANVGEVMDSVGNMLAEALGDDVDAVVGVTITLQSPQAAQKGNPFATSK